MKKINKVLAAVARRIIPFILIFFVLFSCFVSARAEVLYTGSTQVVYPMSQPNDYFIVSAGGVKNNEYREFQNYLFICDGITEPNIMTIWYSYTRNSAISYTVTLDIIAETDGFYAYVYDGLTVIPWPTDDSSHYQFTFTVDLFDGYTPACLFDYNFASSISVDFPTEHGTISPVWAGGYTYLELLEQIESNQTGFISWWQSAWRNFRGWLQFDLLDPMVAFFDTIVSDLNTNFGLLRDWIYFANDRLMGMLDPFFTVVDGYWSLFLEKFDLLYNKVLTRLSTIISDLNYNFSLLRDWIYFANDRLMGMLDPFFTVVDGYWSLFLEKFDLLYNKVLTRLSTIISDLNYNFSLLRDWIYFGVDNINGTLNAVCDGLINQFTLVLEQLNPDRGGTFANDVKNLLTILYNDFILSFEWWQSAWRNFRGWLQDALLSPMIQFFDDVRYKLDDIETAILRGTDVMQEQTDKLRDIAAKLTDISDKLGEFGNSLGGGNGDTSGDTSGGSSGDISGGLSGGTVGDVISGADFGELLDSSFVSSDVQAVVNVFVSVFDMTAVRQMTIIMLTVLLFAVTLFGKVG